MRRLRFCCWRGEFGVRELYFIALFFVTGVFAWGAESFAESNKRPANGEDVYISPTNSLGSWIWDEKVFDNQTCRFWRAFEIPKRASVTRAQLVMTADNEFTVYLDGRELGHGTEWRELFIFDVGRLLPPGRHVLAVKCYNGSFFAGMLFGLRIEFRDGPPLELKSDSEWRVAPAGEKHWETREEAVPAWPVATIKAPLGGDPWWKEPMAVNRMPPVQPIKVWFWQTGWFQAILVSVCGLVILFSIWLMMQLALRKKERALLQAERARIARDIHDDIGARMTQLVLYGEVAKNELPADAATREQFGWMCDEARGLLSTMDEILWAVNPQRDTVRDFAAYVCKYAREFLKPTPIQCFFEVSADIPAAALDLAPRRSLLMAIKETLNNAVKHSEATELRLQIQWEGQRLLVVVQDNGKGIDRGATASERHGMTNMCQRMEELGGTCAVVSGPGQGCRIELSVPLVTQRWHPRGWMRKWKPHLKRSQNPDGPRAENSGPAKDSVAS
jgi:signal transduction histidine kinase